MTLQSVEVTETQQALDEALSKGLAPLIITRDGKPIAVVVPLGNTDLETASLSLNPSFLSIIERSRLQLRHSAGITSADMEGRFA